MAEPLTVLHVFGQMNTGGAEMRTLEVMRCLDPAQIRLLFCTLSGQPGDLDEEIRRLGGDVLPCRLGPLFPFRFLRLLRRHRVHAVHSHVMTFSGLPLVLAQVAAVPVRIAHFRSDGDGKGDGWPRRAQRRLLKMLIQCSATRVLAVSPAAMSSAWSPSWRSDWRCQVVYNGIDLRRFTVTASAKTTRQELGVPADAALCISVGRSTPAKNRLRMLGMMAELLPLQANAYLVVVGTVASAERVALDARAGQLGVSHRLIYTGNRSDVPKLLQAADLLLAPSTREGLPGVILEACAAGTPSLTSDLPGTLEIAKYFSTVACLSLRLPDDAWAATAAQLLSEPVEMEGRADSLRSFSSSPFVLQHTVRNLTAVWTAA